MKPSRLLPWQVFRWFLLNQALLLAIVIGLFGTFVYIVLDSQGTPLVESWDSVRSLVFVALVALLLASTILSIWMARKLLFPLGRLVVKARQIETGSLESVDLEPMKDDNSTGEWVELERALDKLGRDLQVKTESLNREREELRAIMGSVSDAILAIDSASRILFYNNQFALLYGLKIHAHDLRLHETMRSPDVIHAIEESLQTSKPVQLGTTIYVENGKQPRYFSVAVSPLIKDNVTYGAVCTFHDVTDMKTAEQMRIDFVGNVSHELRTPLTSIKGYMQTLASDIREQRYDATEKFLTVIERNVDRLIALVSDLLDLSAIESGASFRKVEIDPQAMTEGVLRQVDAERKKKDLMIQMRFDIAEFHADADRVEQVIINLVQNAVKYVPSKSRIDISWEAPTNNEVILRVKDNGQGIPYEHQARLFERFYRVDEGRDRELGGTGLGLAIVKHIMQRHGGSVEVKSDFGQGAEFICHFPQ